LKFLHLNNAAELGLEGLKAIGVLPNLISLQLHNVKHLCSDELLCAFRNGKPENLVSLSLAGCTCMNDEVASAIAQLFPQIHELSLARVKGITDKGMEIIIKQCSSLKYLDIFEMQSMTGSSFACIPQYAHKLNFLLIEDFCDMEKEDNYIAYLKFNSKFQVHCTPNWESGNLQVYTASLII